MKYGLKKYRPLASGMGEAVARRTILRKKSNGHTESWGDVAQRVSIGNCSLVKSTTQAEKDRLQAHIANGSILMSGRHLQHGDDTQNTRNGEIFTNCFHRDVKFLTLEYGPVSFGEVVGRTVTVKARDGVWRPAEIKAFGKQILSKITFSTRSGQVSLNAPITTIATRNHRWFLEDGKETTSLKEDDYLELPTTIEKDDDEAIQHGLIFGNGSTHKSRPDYPPRIVSQGRDYEAIRLCGNDKKYLNYFEGMSVSYPPHANGDPVVYLGKKPFWKELPFCTDPSYISGFIYGWWLADGSKTYSSTRNRIEISTCRKDAVDWLFSYAAYAGYRVCGTTERKRKENDGSFANGKTLYSVRLAKDEAIKASSFEDVGIDEVYCAVEPVTHGFVLGNGILTGNCSTSATSFMLYYLLLNGSGVGRSYDDDICVVDWRKMPYVHVVLSQNHPDYDYRTMESPSSAKHKYTSNGDTTGASIHWFEVPDSREGWAKAVEFIESMAYSGKNTKDVCIIDFSNVRAKGAAIKGMQGRPSSGPVPMMNSIRAIATLKGANIPKWKQAMYVDHYLAECVLVGGARRSARMSTKQWRDPGVIEFVSVKKGEKEAYLWSSNNSVTVDAEFWKLAKKKGTWANQVFDAVCSASYHDGTGEPGFINQDRLVANDDGLEDFGENFVGSELYKIEHGKDLMIRLKKVSKTKQYPYIVNPCIVGDTLVAVADGRGTVPISVLAQEGKDIPVYCYDQDEKITIRTMRNPRITGENIEVFAIELDDGSILKATENHKFFTSEGVYKEVKNLIPGEGLRTMTRYSASIKDIFSDVSSRSQDYWWICGGQRENKAEHRLIAEFYSGRSLKNGEIVHHRDRDGKNNKSENLEIMTKKAHDHLHSADMIGDKNQMRRAATAGKNNGMFCGASHEDVRTHVLALTKKLGRRISTDNWVEYAKSNDLPMSFSKWRKDHLGGMTGVFKHAAVEAGIDAVSVNADPRVVATYKEMLSEGYDAEIVDGEVVINKCCEVCNVKFTTPYAFREVGVCSHSCRSKAKWDKPSYRSKMKANAIARKEKLGKSQLNVFLQLKFELKRLPSKSEFDLSCAKAGVKSYVLSNGSAPFKSYSDLKSAAETFNHRVVSVKSVGYETVYNGTVDEFHNFFVGGFEGVTKNGKTKTVFVNNLQCGEIVLHILGGFCVIGDVVPYFTENIGEAEEAVRLTARALIRANTMDSVYGAEVHRTNRIGVGLTGIHEWAWSRYGFGFRDLIDETIGKPFWMDLARLSRAVKDEAIKYSAELGVTRPHTDITIKPAGSTSKLFGLTEGAHLPSMKEYIRWVQFRLDDPLYEKYKNLGYRCMELKTYQGSGVVGFPTQPEICKLGMEDKLVTAPQATPEEQYRWLMLLEKYWIRGVDEKGELLAEDTGNQVSYCLAGDGQHLITTKDGLKRIEFMSECKVVDRNGKMQNVTDLVDNGIKPTKRMRLNNGLEIIGTAEHKVLTVNSEAKMIWKRLFDILPGDTVVRRVGDNMWSKTQAKLPSIKSVGIDGHRKNINFVKTPKSMSVEMGLFLGMLMSDGSISENGISLSNENQNVLKTFRKLTMSLFGLSGKMIRDNRTSKMFDFEVNSRILSRWILSLGVARYHDDNAVPECVLHSKKDTVMAFVKGYTLDGFGNKNANVCVTVSKKMAKDLCSILSNAGYDAILNWKEGRPYFFSDTNQGIGKDQYTVTIPESESIEYVKEIGFAEQRKNKAVLQFCRRRSGTVGLMANSIPALAFQNIYSNDRSAFIGNEKLRSIMKAKSNSISIGAAKEYFNGYGFDDILTDDRLRFTKVESIEDSGDFHTFDITVSKSHEYIANSIVVHNTLKYFPDRVSFADFKDMMLQYQSKIKCCSVMPQGDVTAYEYQPEQPVNLEDYNEYVKNIKEEIEEDLDKIHIDCAGGACPVDFKKEVPEPTTIKS